MSFWDISNLGFCNRNNILISSNQRGDIIIFNHENNLIIFENDFDMILCTGGVTYDPDK